MINKIYKVIAAISLIVFSFFSGFSQVEQCATMEVLQLQESQDPGLKGRMAQIEQMVQSYLASPNNRNSSQVVITIPVVVHVVHNGEPIGTGPNISDAQVLSQIEVLNEDFRRLNADTVNTPAMFDSLAADTQIEFCLATLSPNGMPTNGINRVNGGSNGWSTSAIDGNLKPQTIWNRNNYLNMWSVKFSSNGLLGYAQFPGGSASTDGVVINYRNFGRYPANPISGNYDLGRTATHEVGHWLNLRHIWGDGPCGQDDFVMDTPESDASNSGCPVTHVSCSTIDMVQNYMDYTYDDCMNIFTEGQANRMIASLNASRASLFSSPGCMVLASFSYGGQVVDSVSNTGIPYAEVLFTNGVFNLASTADTNGYFTFPSFYEGTYDVYAGSWGYMTKLRVNDTIDSTSSAATIHLSKGYYDDFLLDFAWNKGGTATTGLWTRGEPIGTTYSGATCNPGSDVAGDFGLKCYVTGNAGGSAGTDDVDNGTAILSSPLMDLTGYVDPYISYYRWFYNAGGSTPADDKLIVRFSDGVNVDTVEIVTASGPNAGQWYKNQFRVQDYFTLSNSMQIELWTADLGQGHLVEAGLDLFRVKDSLIGNVLPVASFTSGTTSICVGNTISFTETSTNGPNVLSWSFAGGTPSTSNSPNPLVSYNNPGTYSVTLIASNLGGSDTTVIQNYITVHPNPSATAGSVNISCKGANDGSAFVLASGAAAPFIFNWSNGSALDSIAGLSAGFHSVTVTDSNGCFVTASTFVSEPQDIILSLTSSPENASGSNGTATVVSTGGVPPYTFLWNDPGQQTASTATGLAGGVYQVIVTDANGCTKSGLVTVHSTVGISFNQFISNFNFFPNPTSGIVTIQLTLNSKSDILIRLTNILGELILEKKIKDHQSGNILFDLKNQTTGIYFMTIQAGSDSITRKITVIR